MAAQHVGPAGPPGRLGSPPATGAPAAPSNHSRAPMGGGGRRNRHRADQQSGRVPAAADTLGPRPEETPEPAPLYPSAEELEVKKARALELILAMTDNEVWAFAERLTHRGLMNSEEPLQSNPPSRRTMGGYSPMQNPTQHSPAPEHAGTLTMSYPHVQNLAQYPPTPPMQNPMQAPEHAGVLSMSYPPMQNLAQHSPSPPMQSPTQPPPTPDKAGVFTATNHSSYPGYPVPGVGQPISVADHLSLSHSQPTLTPELQPEKAGGGQPSKALTEQDTSDATTLVLRNLPKEHNQQSVQDWVDNFGYAGLYDFLLFFPAKLTARLNSFGYAFVNFRRAEDAQRFKREAHLMTLPTEEDAPEGTENVRLSVVVAKAQGFAENYARYQHHLVGSTPTQCVPFFAPDMLLALGVSPTAPHPSGPSPETTSPEAAPNDSSTTIVIRNLPNSMEGSDVTREWLDGEGFAGLYDFFIYFPAKKSRTGQVAAPQSMAYAFLNFKEPAAAEACRRSLNGRSLIEGDDRVLSVVMAKMQGLDACIAHFTPIAENGRCSPWVSPEAAGAAGVAKLEAVSDQKSAASGVQKWQ